MSERNDQRMIEDACVALAMYLDMNGVSGDQGLDIAESLAAEIGDLAEARYARMMVEGAA